MRPARSWAGALIGRQTKEMTGMATVVIGNSFKVDFGERAYRLDFHSETRMTWTALALEEHQPTDESMTVDITRTEIRPDVFMVYWTEPSVSITVVHVQDFENRKVWTNITMPGGNFLNLSGSLTPVLTA